MMMIIGLVTMSTLVWLLAWSMAGESDAERRRLRAGGDAALDGNNVTKQTPTRIAQAA